MISEPQEPGFYHVRWYTPLTWTVAEWRTSQRVPWLSGLHGAWFVIGHEGPCPLPTFCEIGEKIELSQFTELRAQNERLREAIEGISQNPEYVQAAGWWGRFAAVLSADRRKLRELLPLTVLWNLTR